MEGEVGITHMYKAKHIFNSLGTPGLKTFNKTSMWNLIQLRLRSANRSHKCASFCRQQIHGLIQFPRALTAPQQPHKNLGSKTAFTADLWLLLHAVSEDLRITGWKSRGIPGVRREPLVINTQVPLLPGQRLPYNKRQESGSYSAHAGPLKLILKEQSGTSQSCTGKLSTLNISGCTPDHSLYRWLSENPWRPSLRTRAGHPCYLITHLDVRCLNGLAQPQKN